jgi:hypothetical protein
MLIATWFITLHSVAQTCTEAVQAIPEVLFEVFDVNGKGYATFTPTQSKVYIGLANPNQTLPTGWQLFTGSCDQPTIIGGGILHNPYDGFWYFTFDTLQIGTPYFLELSDTTGNGYSVSGYLTEMVSNAGNCDPAHPCNYVANPNFEQPDPAFTLPVGGSFIGGQPFFALTDEACGWERASTNPSCTPEYFLSPMDVSYGVSPCLNTGANGNSCTNQSITTNGGQGAMDLFTIDLNANNSLPNRREYVFTEFPNGFVAQPGIYAMRVSVRHNTQRTVRCNSLQAKLELNYTPVTHPDVLNIGTPEVDLSTQISLTDPNWQTVWSLFAFTGTASSLVLGNFLDNATTLLPAHFLQTGTPQGIADFRPKMYIDNVGLFQLPNAGPDITLCDPGSVQIGFDPNCPPPGPPGTLSLNWTYLNTNTSLGSTAIITVNPLTVGQHNYRLTINYEGQTFIDEVTVTVAPDLTTNTLGDDLCDGQASFAIPNLPDWVSWNFASPNNSVTLSSQPTANGTTLTFNNPIVTAHTGIGTVTGTIDYYINGVLCTKQLTLQINACCRTFKTDYVFLPHGSNVSQALAGQGVQINNTIFTVYGNVTIDDDYTFDQCQFYLMPDARLIIDNNRTVNFDHSSLQPCGNLRWNEVEVLSQAILVFNYTTTSGSIRGVHLRNESSFDCGQSTFNNNYCSIFIDQCDVTSSTINIYNSTFICEGLNHAGISQAQGSTVPMANPQNYITGIMLLNSDGISIGNPTLAANTFTTTTPSNVQVKGELSYINLYNSREIAIYNNHFGFAAASIWARNQSNYVVGGNTAGQPNHFAPAVYTNGVTPYTGNGIKADASWGTIANNTFTQISNAGDFSNLELQSLTFGPTEVLNNTIDAYWALAFAQPQTTGSRIRILNNAIAAVSRGIRITDFVECDTQSNRIFINSNSITMAAPTGSNPLCKGIDLQNTFCVTIGNNTITTATSYTPPGNHTQVVGIHLNQSQFCRVSLNDFTRFNYGLLMDNEAGTTDYSCMTFNTCYTSVLYKDITANFVRPVTNFYPALGSTGDASGNTFINNLNPAGRVDALGTFNVITRSEYHYDGIQNGDEDPKLTTLAATYVLQRKDKNPGTCDNLPNAKQDTKESTVLTELSINIFPNPSTTGQFNFVCNSTFGVGYIAIYSSTGKLVKKIKLSAPEAVFDIAQTPGLYILHVELDNEVYYEKVVVTGN